MSLSELAEELRRVDEVQLVELLGVTSAQIVDAFLDTIDDEQDRLIKYFNDEY
jgi:hypothetical protein